MQIKGAQAKSRSLEGVDFECTQFLDLQPPFLIPVNNDLSLSGPKFTVILDACMSPHIISF